MAPLKQLPPKPLGSGGAQVYLCDDFAIPKEAQDRPTVAIGHGEVEVTVVLVQPVH
jgi:hypothetical protein